MVGACIVNQENKFVGIGNNNMPNGCDDNKLPWSGKADDKYDTKYPYVCHAELNAIMNKNSADVKGGTMYVTLFPCNECAKIIIQAGTKWKESSTKLTTNSWNQGADYTRHGPSPTDKPKSRHRDSDSQNVKQCRTKTQRRHIKTLGLTGTSERLTQNSITYNTLYGHLTQETVDWFHYTPKHES
ncbi:hypothetical protein DPEC_G00186230 [Dallia pectoralis]|uniref:Uncharacterized protein n=1 Tax=Dallia pectoralis TaxID=75939 RepID=A0ACC2GBT7_DALPE|nr:hypothetical protein DPEC_G00186230 [Dallia pectoralis]